MSSRVTAAVERALDDRQRAAAEEVERILAAAVRVMERVAPEPLRVSDIVAEAGSSNKAFYRYFAGKDDVILAVMERGVAIMRPLRDLLTEPVAALGSTDVRRDTDAVFDFTAAAVRRYLDSTERPGPADIDHLVRFRLRGLGVTQRQAD